MLKISQKKGAQLIGYFTLKKLSIMYEGIQSA